MKTSESGFRLIALFEGLASNASSVWRIGDRSGGPGDPSEAVFDPRKAVLLRRDIAERETLFNGWAMLNRLEFEQHEFDALMSFITNIGFEAFKGSTAARWLRQLERRERIAGALEWWVWARAGGRVRRLAGLERRRAVERALFLSPSGWGAPLNAADIDWRECRRRPEFEARPLKSWLPWSVKADFGPAP